MKLEVVHRTRFAYAAPVRESFNEARLHPVNSARQTCHRFELRVTPQPRVLPYVDFYGNSVHQFEVPQPHTELLVDASSTVTTSDAPGLARVAFTNRLGEIGPRGQAERCFDYLQPSTYVDVNADLTTLATKAAAKNTDAWQAAQAIMALIHREFHYQPAATTSHTHMREVLQTKTGVCQDFAHVMLGLCRALQLPARYVSGYLYNGPADQLKGAQASHAWVEVYLPAHGWQGLDPTNGAAVDARYVKVAHGRDYVDVTPVKGTYRGTGSRTMTIEVLVTRVEDAVLRPA